MILKFRMAGVLLAGWLVACTPQEAPLPWAPLSIDSVGLQVQFPCTPQTANTPVDFGLGGAVTVHMLGCDAAESTFAVSHWLLEDAKQADDALSFWQAAVLTQLKPVDGGGQKSGSVFMPQGAMDLSRSIRATVQGEGPSGWTITTHGVWFARQEGEKARIFHAVVYAPNQQEALASRFFNGLVLYPPQP